MVIQDNLSSEKHIDELFDDTFRMLRNIQMTSHFLNNDMMRKMIVTMIRSELQYAEVIWSLTRKTCVEIGKNTENSN